MDIDGVRGLLQPKRNLLQRKGGFKKKGLTKQRSGKGPYKRRLSEIKGISASGAMSRTLSSLIKRIAQNMLTYEEKEVGSITHNIPQDRLERIETLLAEGENQKAFETLTANLDEFDVHLQASDKTDLQSMSDILGCSVDVQELLMSLSVFEIPKVISAGTPFYHPRKLKILQLGQLIDDYEVHKYLQKHLHFPGGYNCNWDAFWDTLIRGSVGMPEVLRMKGWEGFAKKLPSSAKSFLECLLTARSSRIELLSTEGKEIDPARELARLCDAADEANLRKIYGRGGSRFSTFSLLH